MAIVLDTNLKHNGKFYDEGTPVGDLPKAVAKIAKEAGILVQRVDPDELEQAIAALEDDEDESEEEAD